jgi:hypothetical protein
MSVCCRSWNLIVSRAIDKNSMKAIFHDRHWCLYIWKIPFNFFNEACRKDVSTFVIDHMMAIFCMRILGGQNIMMLTNFDDVESRIFGWYIFYILTVPWYQVYVYEYQILESSAIHKFVMTKWRKSWARGNESFHSNGWISRWACGNESFHSNGWISRWAQTPFGCRGLLTIHASLAR